MNLGGVVPLSTVDWEGLSATVIFFRGCPLRCPYCHNRELQDGENLVDLQSVVSQVMSAVKGQMRNDRAFFGDSGQIDLAEACERANERPMVNAIVLSGGEPLMQPEQAAAIFRMTRILGLKTGLETSGCYPERLSGILQEDLVDKIFLDIKGAFCEDLYARASGRRNIAHLVEESARVCMKSGVELEIRTTVFPDMPSNAEIIEIVRTLKELRSEYPENRLKRLVLQQGLLRDGEFDPVSRERLELLAQSLDDLVEVKVKAAPEEKTDKKSIFSTNNGRT